MAHLAYVQMCRVVPARLVAHLLVWHRFQPQQLPGPRNRSRVNINAGGGVGTHIKPTASRSDQPLHGPEPWIPRPPRLDPRHGALRYASPGSQLPLAEIRPPAQGAKQRRKIDSFRLLGHAQRVPQVPGQLNLTNLSCG
ncbi:hypothetical protein GCM10027290_50210 [Micromonospora sonneratiae]